MNGMAKRNEGKLTLVLGGTGKTGRRVVIRLEDVVCPSEAVPGSVAPFNWEAPGDWRQRSMASALSTSPITRISPCLGRLKPLRHSARRR